MSGAWKPILLYFSACALLLLVSILSFVTVPEGTNLENTRTYIDRKEIYRKGTRA